MNVRWRTSERTFALADSVRCQPKGTYGILEPVLAGTRSMAFDSYEDDLQYVVDVGLVAPGAAIKIANPIYREVIMRVLGSIVER